MVKAGTSTSCEFIYADSLVLALGHDTDLSLPDRSKGVTIEDGAESVGASLMTIASGIFAGGDSVRAQRTAAVAVANGKHAARNIDAYVTRRDAVVTGRYEFAIFERLNTWYYAPRTVHRAPRTAPPELEWIRRQVNFDAVIAGLNRENTLVEVRRYLSCGSFFKRNNCFVVGLDNVVTKLGSAERYEFCKCWGVRVSQSTCGAIDLVPERN